MFFKAIKSLALAGVISIGCLANVRRFLTLSSILQ